MTNLKMVECNLCRHCSKPFTEMVDLTLEGWVELILQQGRLIAHLCPSCVQMVQLDTEEETDE